MSFQRVERRFIPTFRKDHVAFAKEIIEIKTAHKKNSAESKKDVKKVFLNLANDSDGDNTMLKNDEDIRTYQTLEKAAASKNDSKKKSVGSLIFGSDPSFLKFGDDVLMTMLIQNMISETSKTKFVFKPEEATHLKGLISDTDKLIGDLSKHHTVERAVAEWSFIFLRHNTLLDGEEEFEKGRATQAARFSSSREDVGGSL